MFYYRPKGKSRQVYHERDGKINLSNRHENGLNYLNLLADAMIIKEFV
jgi:hypothetical protein